MCLVAVTKVLLVAGNPGPSDHVRFQQGCQCIRWLCLQRIHYGLYQLGLTGILITNMNNKCSTGSTALVHVLALDFERMASRALGTNSASPDHPAPCASFSQPWSAPRPT
ncbi:hypothetical protein EDB89DRAFT_841381 [Lactarius sanguifluus]|nr:hypothetical protein EDB89DRAFT_841381 [Lactarius sanguifluus]